MVGSRQPHDVSVDCVRSNGERLDGRTTSIVWSRGVGTVEAGEQAVEALPVVVA